MLRRNFMKTAGLLAAAPVVKGVASPVAGQSTREKQIYEWRIYTLPAENSDLDTFYRQVLIPAYNRRDITVGAFVPYKPAEQIQRFYLFVYPDLGTYQQVKHVIWQDAAFRKEAQPFYDASASAPVYTVFESFLCEAFDRVPRLLRPDASRTLLEFRNYKSPNE